MDNQNNNQPNLINTQPISPVQPVMPQPTPSSFVPPQSPVDNQSAGQRSHKVLFLSLGLFVVIAIIALGAFFAYTNGLIMPKSNFTKTVSQIPAPTLTPTPTPVVVNNPQDLQGSLNAVNSTDPNSFNTDLNQNAVDASQF